MIRGLDLFCNAGGATAGYQNAFRKRGFPLHMEGIDIRPQPRYIGDKFIQADVMDILLDTQYVRQFDFVHMSPPCQAWSPTRTFAGKGGREHPDLVIPTLTLVRELYPDMIWITENVLEAPMYSRVHQILRLCASSFPGHSAFDERRLLHRHRQFRLHNFQVPQVPCAHNGFKPKGVYGSLNSDIGSGGEIAANLAEARKLMQIHWMKWGELKEAIPPAYTEYVSTEGMIEAVLAR